MVNKPLTDAIMLAVSLLGTIFFCRSLFRHPDCNGRRGAIFLMVFFAMISFINMWAHEWAIGLMAFTRWRQGLFVYDFRFYSLMLLGVVFIGLAGYLLHQVKLLSRGSQAASRRILVAGTIQILLSLPLFPFNPIGVLPALSSVLLLMVLPFARRQVVQKQVSVAA